jgi:hypothetical protein
MLFGAAGMALAFFNLPWAIAGGLLSVWAVISRRMARRQDLQAATQTGIFGPRERRVLVAVLGCLVGVVITAFLARYTVGLWAGAASACEIFEAGGMFAAAIFVLPAFGAIMWSAWSVPLLLLARRSLILGVTISICLVIAIAYWFVSGTGPMIRASGEAADFCPSGVPAWWPSWLPT